MRAMGWDPLQYSSAPAHIVAEVDMFLTTLERFVELAKQKVSDGGT